jgi:hypothetical protein
MKKQDVLFHRTAKVCREKYSMAETGQSVAEYCLAGDDEALAIVTPEELAHEMAECFGAI